MLDLLPATADRTVKLPRPVAWLILILAFFTAGILRQYHDRIPAAPNVSPLVGSLLFGAILLLLLVASRERRLGALREEGVRVGSLTPILLMLLVEKWISLHLYDPVFSLFADPGADDPLSDAQYRAFTGVALILITWLVSAFSPGARSRMWRRTRPDRWPAAMVGTLFVVVAVYVVLGVASGILGGGLDLAWPTVDTLWLWVLFGQGIRAFSEELYYRGLLLAEMERLSPRLGIHTASGRRWAALLPVAVLFSLEHLTVSVAVGPMTREAVFTFSLGLLLGILVLVTNNLHFAAGVHAYVNWLILGAAPRFVDPSGQAALPPGTYVGLVLVLAFVLTFVTQRGRKSEMPIDEEPLGSPDGASG